MIFKVGKGDYRGFMASPEGLAGIHAVNADAVEMMALPNSKQLVAG